MKSYKYIGWVLVTGLLIVSCQKSVKETDETPKVVVWAFGAEGNNLSQLTDKYPGKLDIEIVAIPWEQANEKLNAALISGGPDIVQLGTTWIAQFADVGVLADLSSLGEFSSFDPSLYFPGSSALMNYNNQLVSVPWYVDVITLYYRTDILAEHGFNQAPKTWQEVLDISASISDKEKGLYAYDFDLPGQFTASILGWQNGWEMFNEAGQPQFTDPKFIQGLDYMKSLYDNSYASRDTIGTDVLISFDKGDVAMFAAGPWMAGIIESSAPSAKDNYAVTLMPGNPEQTSFMGGSNLVIFESSKVKEEAAKLLDWMVSEPQQITWFEINKVLPSSVSAWDSDVIQQDASSSVFFDQLNQAQPVPSIPEWEQMAQEIVRLQKRVAIDPAVNIEKEAAKLQATVLEMLQ